MTHFKMLVFTLVLIGAAALIVAACDDGTGSRSGSTASASQGDCIRHLGNQNLSAASSGNCRQVLGSEYCSYVRGAIGYRIEEGKDIDRLINLRNLHC